MAILGIDEVGRGPWAGPLLVCACVLHEPIPDLTDSKQLTAKKREALEPIIKQKSSYGLGWVSAAQIDKIGLSRALRQATRAAVKEVKAPFHQIIIDGTVNFLSGTALAKHTTTLIKADLHIPEVSAASILAKVARDNYMKNLAPKYPNYHFEKHVGYGTALHRAALETYGPCPEHRTTFRPVAKCFEKSKVRASREPLPCFFTTKSLGDRAEQVVAEYLESEGHTILHRNWRTKTCEIDIISTKGNTLYFTEVKYRKDSNHGTPLEAITPKKQTQLLRAAGNFIKFHPHLNHLSPLLSAAAVTGKNFTLQDFLTLP